ncbi:MAG: DUF2334 domain-containing protein [Parcubacteria group bacterium]|nr:DUF2334 domain-containing protein [Parcubacteria group bacterium]
MARIFFRLDDIAPNMNWDNFNSLVAIFKKYSVRPLILIIPDNKDAGLLKYPARGDFWQTVKELVNDGWSFGQHGYQHLYKIKEGGILNINKKSEFAGVGYKEQSKIIAEGRGIMQINGLSPEIFSAPGHSFDKNTILALKENGFKYLSDGIALYPFKKWELRWLPQIMWRPRKILFGMATVALHPNTMLPEDLNNLEKFIKENRERVGNFEELIKWKAGFNAPVILIANRIFKIFWYLMFYFKFKIVKY